MAQKPSIPKGTRDFGPVEMAKRNYIFNTIKDVYALYGFQQIETPAMETLQTLMGKYGEEGDKLLFKILNSGDYMNKVSDEDIHSLGSLKLAAKLCEKGLRYDLTVPFARYVVQHREELQMPFKRDQIQPVWRADRPQRGRFRQFMQCDIDILGEPSILAEIELILATTTLLGKLDFTNFTIRINNRKILKAMAAYCGFQEAEYDSVFIILDKMDKIGMDGVTAELLEAGYDRKSVDMCKELFETVTNDIAGVNYLKEKLGDCLEAGTAEDLETIISTVEETKSADFKIAFDPTLVRGMSYYTGPIFELSMDEFGGSVGGGGRYDEMIGKFTGNDTCACGFSIGFERIVMLLLERDFKVPSSSKKKAYLIDKKATPELMKKVISQANEERKNGYKISINVMKKNKKFQKELLAKDGYEEIREFFAD